MGIGVAEGFRFVLRLLIVDIDLGGVAAIVIAVVIAGFDITGHSGKITITGGFILSKHDCHLFKVVIEIELHGSKAHR